MYQGQRLRLSSQYAVELFCAAQSEIKPGAFKACAHQRFSSTAKNKRRLAHIGEAPEKIN